MCLIFSKLDHSHVRDGYFQKHVTSSKMHVLEVTSSSEENVQESSGGSPAGSAVSLDRWFEAVDSFM